MKDFQHLFLFNIDYTWIAWIATIFHLTINYLEVTTFKMFVNTCRLHKGSPDLFGEFWRQKSTLFGNFLGPENKQSLLEYFWTQKLTFFGVFCGQKLIHFEDFWLIFLEPETDKFWRFLGPETDTF